MKKIAYVLVLLGVLLLHLFTRTDAPTAESMDAAVTGETVTGGTAASGTAVGSTAAGSAQSPKQIDYDLIQYTGHLVSFKGNFLPR